MLSFSIFSGNPDIFVLLKAFRSFSHVFQQTSVLQSQVRIRSLAFQKYRIRVNQHRKNLLSSGVES